MIPFICDVQNWQIYQEKSIMIVAQTEKVGSGGVQGALASFGVSFIFLFFQGWQIEAGLFYRFFFSQWYLFIYLFFIYFYQLEANYFTILQWFLSYIDMNQPWIYMQSPSRSPLPPPSPPDSSGSSQCTRPEHLSHASNLGW